MGEQAPAGIRASQVSVLLRLSHQIFGIISDYFGIIKSPSHVPGVGEAILRSEQCGEKRERVGSVPLICEQCLENQSGPRNALGLPHSHTKWSWKSPLPREALNQMYDNSV